MPPSPDNDSADGAQPSSSSMFGSSPGIPRTFPSGAFSFVPPALFPMLSLNVHLPSGAGARHGIPQVMQVDVKADATVAAFKRTLALILACDPDGGKMKLIADGRVVEDREVVGDLWTQHGAVHMVIHPSAWKREGLSPESSPGAASTESSNGWVNLGASTSASTSLPQGATPVSTIPSTIPALYSLPPLPPANSVTAESLPRHPHQTAQMYYLFLYLCALATLTSSPLPENPYPDAETELRARIWARVYVEIVIATDAGLGGLAGCEIAGVAQGEYADAQWRTVYVDGLPYLMRASSLPVSSPEHRKALTTLLSTQHILHLLSRPPPIHPTLVPGLNDAPSQLAALINAAFNGRPPAPAAGNIQRRVYRITLRLPPFSFIVGVFFAFLRIAFICFILTRTGGFTRRVAVAIGAAFWAMWELQRLARNMRVGRAQNNAAAGQHANANNANPNAGGNGNQPAPAAPAGPVDPNPPSPVMTYLASLGLPHECALLFPGLPPDTANPLRRPTVFDTLVATPGFAELFGFVCNVLPEFSKLRARALGERERRVREVYGPMRRLQERRESARAAGTGEVVLPTEDEERATLMYARLATRHRRYVERVLRGDVDDVAVMWAAAEGQGDEVNGIMF